MQKQTISFISTVLLLLVSILMLAIGLRFLPSKYLFIAGLIYLILAVLFVDGILKKLFDDIL
jgi:hypothetical protein